VSGGRTLSESTPVEDGELQERDQSVREGPASAGVSGKGRKIFFETKSLAEVYAQQGHVSTALEIYRSIQQRHPDDQQAANRVAELEARTGLRRGTKPKSDMPGQGESRT
jgi:predicted PilT family ATPase